VNAFPSPEHDKDALLAAIHASAGTFCTRIGHWHRRPPGYLAVFSTFARLRPFSNVICDNELRRRYAPQLLRETRRIPKSCQLPNILI